MANSTFKQFDTVTGPTDHFYARMKPRKMSAALSKRITKEWKILSENLPETIFVRVYEDRMDLLRAAIVGAQFTPYHDGLYFFDIAFPADYPLSPPKVHYWSNGLRINPNLYKSGFVCLSLLNTWSGKSTERWHTAKSTILQVLISLQGLVLNAKPYYNEPGVPPAISSASYNEDVFLLNCMTILILLQSRSFLHFEGFIRYHFRRRGPFILTACRAYYTGLVPVGAFSADGPSSEENNRKPSGGFKTKMRDIYPRLFRAFHDAGADLGDLLPNLEMAPRRVCRQSNAFDVSKIFKSFWSCFGSKTGAKPKE